MDFVAIAIGGSFAQEIKGLELWKPLNTETVERLRLLWKKAGVLLFRRQSLTEDELADFSAHLVCSRPIRAAIGIRRATATSCS
jgi:alpha-ketoglutarate-dependent taurine dioxygenase